MELNNINFKLLSLDAQGIYSFLKGKTVFNWLRKSGGDVSFLQERIVPKIVPLSWRFAQQRYADCSEGTKL